MTDIQRLEEVSNVIGRSFNAMCNDLKVNRNTFTDIKSGKCRISEKLARKMQEKYNISEMWLLTGNGEMFVTPYQSIVNSGDFATNTINTDITQQLSDLISIQKDYQKMMQEKDKQITYLLSLIQGNNK